VCKLGGALLIALVTFACGGNGMPAKKQETSAVPRITPPQRRAEPATQPVADATPEPTPQPPKPIGPWMQVSVAGGEPFECRGYLKLHSAGSVTVVEIANYDAPHHEEFPSVYIRALAPNRTLAELVQTPLTASLAIQVEDSGHLIHNPATQPFELVITEIEGKSVRGTFTGQAFDIALGGSGTVAGKFQAVLE